jgi:hypothetical protein
VTSPSPYAPPKADLSEYGKQTGSRVACKYTLKASDWLRWNVTHFFRTPSLQFLFVGLGCFFAWTDSASASSPFIVRAATGYVILMSLQLGALSVLALVTRDPTVLTTYELELTDEGVSIKTPYAQNLVFWHGLPRLVVTGEIIILYISKRAAHLIPKRAFGSGVEREQFISILTARRAEA